MNMLNQYNKYKNNSSLFRCPICFSSIYFKGDNSFVCGNAHCFDISRLGYINFLSNKSSTQYTKELFESRSYIFKKGFYIPLLEEIIKNIKYYEKQKNLKYIKLLDVGCGEGYYINKIHDINNEIDGYAIDNVKEAIVLAAKEESENKWIVGDLSNIPLQTNSIDIILNIFTPSNYKEFTRVLKKYGIIIKVVPGKYYLQEIRDIAKEEIRNKNFSNEQVIEYFKQNITFLDGVKLNYKKEITKEDLQNFIKMTPMTFHVNKENLNIDNIETITLDFEIIIGENSNKN